MSSRPTIPATGVAALPVRRPPSPGRAVRASLLLLTLLAGVAAGGAAVAQEPTREAVTVPGVGTVYGEPDRATLELGVQAVGSDARGVIQETNRSMEALQAALRDAGIQDRDVRTVVFDLYREEPYDRDGEPRPVRYRLVHMVQVTVRDVDLVGEVLVAAVDAGADRIGGVRFEVSDRAALEERARSQAFEDARRRAQALADAAGRSLGPALRIDESAGGERPVPQEARMMALGGGDAPVAEGRLAVAVSLTVAFALE